MTDDRKIRIPTDYGNAWLRAYGPDVFVVVSPPHHPHTAEDWWFTFVVGRMGVVGREGYTPMGDEWGYDPLGLEQIRAPGYQKLSDEAARELREHVVAKAVAWVDANPLALAQAVVREAEVALDIAVDSLGVAVAALALAELSVKHNEYALHIHQQDLARARDHAAAVAERGGASK